jgi:hypothetical protein
VCINRCVYIAERISLYVYQNIWDLLDLFEYECEEVDGFVLRLLFLLLFRNNGFVI